MTSTSTTFRGHDHEDALADLERKFKDGDAWCLGGDAAGFADGNY